MSKSTLDVSRRPLGPLRGRFHASGVSHRNLSWFSGLEPASQRDSRALGLMTNFLAAIHRPPVLPLACLAFRCQPFGWSSSSTSAIPRVCASSAAASDSYLGWVGRFCLLLPEEPPPEPCCSLVLCFSCFLSPPLPLGGIVCMMYELSVLLL